MLSDFPFLFLSRFQNILAMGWLDTTFLISDTTEYFPIAVLIDNFANVCSCEAKSERSQY